MRIFKQVCLLLCWGIIFWGGAWKFGFLQPHIKPYLVNFIQFASFLLLFWQSYRLVDILVSRKLNVTVHRLKKKKVIWKFSLLGYSLSIYKIVFVSIVAEKYKIWLSKISLHNMIEGNKNYSCYYSGSNKIRVIDGYIILYRMALIMVGLIILKYFLPYLHMVFTDDLQ
jgi:hypothetical protein